MENSIPFTLTVKNEILGREVATSLKLPLLAGLFRSCGSLTLDKAHGAGVKFASESKLLVEIFCNISLELFPEASDAITLKEVSSIGNGIFLACFYGTGAMKLLKASGFLTDKNEPVMSGGTPNATVFGLRKKRAFLTGVFLGCGYVSDPENAYHLELSCRMDGLCDDIIELASDFSIPFKKITRRKTPVAYLKESDSITSFLALLGASDAVLDFESVRVTKDMRNYANRTTNCDIGNIAKTSAASMEQRDAILHIIEEDGSLKRLSPPLREMAESRLSNPEASIAELAELLSISRSGAYHRLRALMETADSIRASHGEIQ